MIIYKGEPEKDYAIIPLDFSVISNDNWAKNIIKNDINNYKSNITDKKIQESLESVLNHIKFNNSKIITNGYKLENTDLNSKLLEKDIDLYYIENFTYTLDADGYTNNATSQETNRGKNDYMFTINPEKLNINDIEIKNE